jgi:hypothetical protein
MVRVELFCYFYKGVQYILGSAALWEDHEELEDDWRDEKDARQILFPRKAVGLGKKNNTQTNIHVKYNFLTLNIRNFHTS